MIEMLKLLFVGAFLIVLVLSVLFLALIVLCSFVGTGVEACRCLSRRFSTRKTVIPTK
ncbi:MAG: hypothetical protein KAJ97_00310 [Acidobacteria bacterium]|nr:hypothetical protein [Acidobacteriota bacterium]